ncbi:RagB/SusD family nutrient uptake outer membrane protein [Flavobacterium subsaxonicum]|uniref:Membrane protein n=1 Tax=Flavobacterium subsaxonicum WB 4.1-42 = DSM 21790 TaxID=1121898 RepID=A0A0A2MGW2_9FLAO|nr:RagB/SusD family nutrient uptake outer membrane protein [Flavobacterium subsaxonicum]KGO91524.1 membrane protein [Flavobacterium subsaxonicum WB 4.1-42 = DSM 21790]
MKNINLKLAAAIFCLSLSLTSCTDDLDQSDPSSAANPSVDQLYSDPAAYKQTLAKLYAGLATTGQNGPAGSPDISGIDEGASQYIRGMWLMNELTTDEAVIGWNDNTIKDFHYQTWSSSDLFINATFSRLDFQIKNCNEYLRQTSDEKLDSRGVSGELRTEIATYRAEARFLRALSYWHFLDLFGGRVGIVTENDPTTYFLPKQATAQELYDFINTELTEVEGLLKDARTNEYPRADKAAAWMLHSKLYMNAQVYIGTSHYADAMPLLTNIINSGYTLNTSYDQLFYADNDRNGAQNEIIFAVAFDGLNTKTYGGTTFLVHAPVGGSMVPAEFGINGGWGGIRTTSAFVDKFSNSSGDLRSNFHTAGQSLAIADISDFTQGYAVEKFRNIDVNGNPGSDSAGDYADTDFPMFRLADTYLMYAECALRTGQNVGQGLSYVNLVRTRAYGNASGTVGSINLQFILDERARELYFEGHRRTDLVRFGKFTGGTYVWPFKGNTPAGSPTPSFRNIFPIPANALSANPTLTQNPGY